MDKKDKHNSLPIPTPGIATVRLPDTGGSAATHLVPFLQGPGTNLLSTVSTTAKSNRQNITLDSITSEAQISVGAGEMTVFMTNYTALDGFKVSTNKLLDAIILRFTAQNGYKQSAESLRTEVVLPLKEYLKILGKDPENKNQLDILRRSVKADLNTLDNISLEWTEKSGKTTKDYLRMRLLTRHGIIKGNIYVNLSPELACYLTNAYIMDFSLKLLSVSERFPSAYHIGRKMLQTLNYAKRKSPDVEQAIISVSKLLEVCPDIPNVENLTGRHYERDIIVPFESALNELHESGFCQWEYVNAKGQPLTENQLNKLDYKTILDAYIQFSIIRSEN